jgi:hypothetical protein
VLREGTLNYVIHVVIPTPFRMKNFKHISMFFKGYLVTAVIENKIAVLCILYIIFFFRTEPLYRTRTCCAVAKDYRFMFPLF